MKKSSLTLMEIIFSLLIFAICSAVCIQLFVQAYLVSEKNKELSNSLLVVSSVVSLLSNYDLQKSAEILSGVYDSNDGILIIEKSKSIIKAQNHGNDVYELTCVYDGDIIYSNVFNVHQPLVVSNGDNYE
ncbi:MAG: hypothetical protein WBO70_00600 [Erysipelotrichaceae bacterium]